jgi:Ca2+-binding RTX toxin-like protein
MSSAKSGASIGGAPGAVGGAKINIYKDESTSVDVKIAHQIADFLGISNENYNTAHVAFSIGVIALDVSSEKVWNSDRELVTIDGGSFLQAAVSFSVDTNSPLDFGKWNWEGWNGYAAFEIGITLGALGYGVGPTANITYDEGILKTSGSLNLLYYGLYGEKELYSPDNINIKAPWDLKIPLNASSIVYSSPPPSDLYSTSPPATPATANGVWGLDGIYYEPNPSVPSFGVVYEPTTDSAYPLDSAIPTGTTQLIYSRAPTAASGSVHGVVGPSGVLYTPDPSVPTSGGVAYTLSGYADERQGNSTSGGFSDGSSSNDNSGSASTGQSGRTTSNRSDTDSGVIESINSSGGNSWAVDAGNEITSTPPSIPSTPSTSIDDYDVSDPVDWGKPIILDLDGDGIEILQLSQSTIYMDSGGDGLLHRTAWAGTGDGVLFYDPDATGAITEKRQYIFTEWDPTATSDLDALRSIFDSNGDGILNGQDAAFHDFKILATESDGSTIARTLDNLGIESIDLTGDSTHIDLPDGTTIIGQTEFTRTDGSTGTVADAALVADAEGLRVEQTESTDGNGNRTLETVAYDGEGTIAYTVSSVFSPDGSDISHAYDDNGDGAIDRLQTITVADISGDTVKTVTNYLGAVLADAIMTNRTVTTKSADRLTTTIQRDSNGGGWFDQEEIREEQTDGSYINTISDLAEDGSVIRSVSETVSADGLTRTTATDKDGDGNTDLTTTHAITINPDNSRTEEIIEKNADNSVRSTVTEAVSADGQSKIIERDLDGDSNIDTEESLSITVNADGTTDSVLTTRNGNGSIRSVTNSTQSDDALTKTTAVDVDGDTVDDIKTIETTIINGDGSRQTVTTVSNADMSLRSMEKVMLGADKVTAETWRDLNQDGTFQSTDLVRSVVVDATTEERTTTAWTRNADGSVSAKSVSVASFDGLTRAVDVDADGDGDTDTKISDVMAVDGSGAATKTVEIRNQNDTLRSQTVTTTSADGLTIETETNWDGDANVDRYMSDVRKLEIDGSSTRTITTKAGDNTTLLSQSVETQSADRLERVLTVDANGDGETDMVSQSVQAVDGSMTDTTTTYNPDGVVSGTTETTTSANGLTVTSRTDGDGDGVFETATVESTSIAADGSRTTSQSVTNADSSLRSQSESWVRDDGFGSVIKTDADGDGTFERSSESETVLNTNGSRSTTVELKDATDGLLSSAITVVSDDGLITTVSTDRDGDGTMDFTRTTEIDLLADGGTEVTSELFDTTTGGVLRESSRVTTNDNGRSELTELDNNGDGITDREVSREIGDDGTLTITEQYLDTSGGLQSGRVTETSDDGLTTSTRFDQNGDGFNELIVETVRTLNSDGSITEVTNEMGKPLSVFRTSRATTSDDGLQTISEQDWNNDGLFDLNTVDAMSYGADGSETHSVIETAADGSTLRTAVTVTSADRRQVIESVDSDGNGNNDRISTTTIAASGVITSASTWYSTGGAVIATDMVETSANGLIVTRTIDRNGDGEAERNVRDTTVLGQDGSVTQSIEHRDYLHILYASEQSYRSDDGLTLESKFDLDGDGLFDFSTTDVTTFATNGETVRTQTTLNETDDLQSRIETRTSGNGLSVSRDTDYTGSGDVNRSYVRTELGDRSWTETVEEVDDAGELIRSINTSMSADGRTREMFIDTDGDGYDDRSIVSITDLNRTVETTYADFLPSGFVAAKIVETVIANGMSTSFVFDIDGDSVSDISRESEIDFDPLGNRIETFTETYGTGTLSYKEVTTTAADGLSGSVVTDADGDGVTDGTTTWQTTLHDDGSRETISETHYSDGALRSKSIEAISADGRTTTSSYDYDGNGIADKTVVRTVRADGQIVERATTFNKAGLENATFITTTSSDGLETTILRPESVQTIVRSPVDNGSYTWDNGISGVGHIAVEHEIDTLGVETWTSTQETGAGTETFTVRIDGDAKARILAEAARIYDAVVDRDMDFTEIEVLVEHVDNGRLDGMAVAEMLLSSAEFSSRYGTMTNAEFVTQLYLNTYGRAPSLGELDQRLTELDSGLSQAEMVQGLADTVEHYVVGNSHILTNNYDVIMNPAQFERNLDEAYVRSFVEKVIDVVYDREASDLELSYLAQRLLNGEDMLEDVVETLLSVDGGAFGVTSATLVGLSGGALVDQAFLGALGRLPSSDERTTWVDNISSGLLSEAQFVASLAIGVEHAEVGNTRLTYNAINITPTVGTNSANTMNGTSSMDRLEGLDGNDTINGGDGADEIVGGPGDDMLDGGKGNDIYYWAKGDGNDTIDENAAAMTETDTIIFADVSSDDVALKRIWNDNDIKIKIKSTGEEILIVDQLRYIDQRQGIEAIVFSDGVIWDFEEMLRKTVVASGMGNDTRSGYEYSEVFKGKEGDDNLSGAGGDDHFTGGLGNDILKGGNGNDTYYWSKGDGNDTIDETGTALTEADTLVLTDVDSDAVELTRIPTTDNIAILILETGETIEVKDQFQSIADTQGIEKIVFADGIAWSLSDIFANTKALGSNPSADQSFLAFDYRDNQFGDAGDDALNGGGGDDHLTGGTGADTLKGDEGSDTYYWSKGDGNDLIDETGTSMSDIDTLVLTDVASNDVELWRPNGNDKILITIISTGETIDVKDQNYSVDESQGIEAIQFSDGVVWDRADIATRTELSGTASGETLTGYDFRDNIIGKAEDDTINAAGGDDTLDGGTGNDTLRGGTGNDTYIYNLGDESDTIKEMSGHDRIVFGGGITAGSLVFSRSGRDAFITLPDGAVITIRDEVVSRIELLEFADGTILDASVFGNIDVTGTSGSDSYYGHDGADTLHGSSGSDVLSGGAGDDHIYGGSESDTLTGGAGNDTIFGGEGHDTFIYNYGDGSDTIIDESGSNDKLVFGAGIAIDEVAYERVGDDLLVRISDGSVITVEDFNVNYGDIETFVFADGQQVDASRFNDLTLNGGNGANTLEGSIGNDTINGFEGDDTLLGDDGNDQINAGNGDDTLFGGAGVDSLNGGSGSDTYHYAQGDGQDTILDTAGEDKILLSGDISLEDIDIELIGQDLVVSFLNAAGENDRITISNWTNSLQRIEALELPDGKSIDLKSLYADQAGSGFLVEYFDLGSPLDSINDVDWTAAPDYTEFLSSIDINPGAGSLWTGGPTNFAAAHFQAVLNIEQAGDEFDFFLLSDDGSRLYIDDNLVIYNDGLHGATEIKANDESLDAGYHLIDIYYFENAGDSRLRLNWRTETGASVELLSFPEPSITYDPFEWLQGTQSADSINGSTGDDYLFGREGDDSLQGGDGDDYLVGGSGIDILDGGTGTDTASYESESAAVIVNLATNATSGGAAGDSLSNIENLSGSTHDDTLTGDAGANALVGNAGDDTLVGGDGTDTLDGGAGDDTLEGGAGADTLEGGGGADRYLFAIGDGADVISDSGGADTIELSGDVTLGDLDIRLNGNDLVVAFLNAATDSITVTGWTDHQNRVETLLLPDGIEIDLNNLSFGSRTTVTEPNTIDVEYFVVDSSHIEIDEIDWNATPDHTGTVTELKIASTQGAIWSGGPADYVAAYFSTEFQVEAGDYRFKILSDDRSRVLVDGQVVAEVAGLGTDESPYVALGGGAHTLEVYYSDYVSTAELKLSWKPYGGTYETFKAGETVISESIVADTANGIEAAFFEMDGSISSIDDIDWHAAPDHFSRINKIDYNLGTNGSFWSGGQARWVGAHFRTEIVLDDAMDAGYYSFAVNSDDGSVLMIDGEVVLNNDGVHSATTEESEALWLGEGVHTIELYYFENTGDAVVELSWRKGTGAWEIFETTSENTLSPNWLQGSSVDSTITGGTGDDYLLGHGGDDTLIGGTGDDTFYVDSANDAVIEYAGEGTDLVLTSVTYELRWSSQHTENLTLTGSANIDGTGNSLSNTITGNDGDNILNGAWGNDILIGGAGNDTFRDDNGNETMYGGLGDDTFIFVDEFGNDVISDFAAGAMSEDVIEFDDDVFADFAAVLAAAQQDGSDTVITADGNNSVTLSNVALSALHVDDFRFVA